MFTDVAAPGWPSALIRTWLIPGRKGTCVFELQRMVLPSSAKLTAARSLNPRLLSHNTRLSPPVQVRVPWKEMAGSVVTMVRPLDVAGWVILSAFGWPNARLQKNEENRQERPMNIVVRGRIKMVHLRASLRNSLAYDGIHRRSMHLAGFRLSDRNGRFRTSSTRRTSRHLPCERLTNSRLTRSYREHGQSSFFVRLSRPGADAHCRGLHLQPAWGAEVRRAGRIRRPCRGCIFDAVVRGCARNRRRSAHHSRPVH